VIESANKICGVIRGLQRTERDTWWWTEERDTWWWTEEVQQAVKTKKEVFKKWQKCRQDATLNAEYKASCKETERAVAKAKTAWCQKLNL